MRRLPARERRIAAQAFDYLVTPSGTKVAYGAHDLAQKIGRDEDRLERVLRSLYDARILRAVPSADGDTIRYQLYHDVLAKVALDWSSRYLVRARHWRRVGLLVGGGAILAAGLAVSLVFFVRAQDARDEAQANELAQKSLAQLPVAPEESLRLAVAGVEKDETSLAQEALRRALAESHAKVVMTDHRNVVFDAEFSPDDRWVVSASADGTARVWDARTGVVAAVLRHRADSPNDDLEWINAAAFDDSGKRIVTAGEDGTARIWDRDTGKQLGPPLRHGRTLSTPSEVRASGSRPSASHQRAGGSSSRPGRTTRHGFGDGPHEVSRRCCGTVLSSTRRSSVRTGDTSSQQVAGPPRSGIGPPPRAGRC